MIDFKIREKDGPRPALLSVDQFSFLTQLGRTKVYAMIRDGQITSVKIGYQRRIPESEIDRLAREGA
jgi:excisionase family DNA binding protein